MKPILLYSLAIMAVAVPLASARTATAGQPGPDPVRICFPRGKAAVSVNGRLERGTPAQRISDSYFSVRLKNGQHLRIEVDQPSLRGGFISPSGKERIEDGPVVFDGDIDEAGDYQIRIGADSQDGAGDFDLKVEAKPSLENCSGVEDAEKYVGSYPEDLWKERPSLKARLRRLLGPSAKDFFQRMETTVPIEKKGGDLVVYGCRSQMCGSDIAECAWTLARDKWHCAIVYDGAKTKVFSEDKGHLSSEIKEVSRNYSR
jgi:hypothetical protein